MQIGEPIFCDCFLKDLKKLSKKCRGRNIKKEVLELARFVAKSDEAIENHVVLYRDGELILLKSRLKGCSGKGKRGGLRLIWAIYENTPVFVRLYSKSEISNIPTPELIGELLNCLELK